MKTSETPNTLDGIVLVLDRPLDVANVGAVVRVMCNFGLSRLRLVEPAAYDEARILAAAHRSEEVIARIDRFPNLDAALADCAYVLGTTARPRQVRHERMTPRQAAPALLHAAALDPSSPAALLFGPEDRGLSNDALGLCNAVVCIPTTVRFSSLNLAQAALVLAYELWLAASEESRHVEPSQRVPDAAAAVAPSMTGDGDTLARVAAREEMFGALEQVLWGMHPNNDAGRVAHTLARLRALLLRAAPRSEEARMLTTLFLHIAHERRSGGQ